MLSRVADSLTGRPLSGTGRAYARLIDINMADADRSRVAGGDCTGACGGGFVTGADGTRTQGRGATGRWVGWTRWCIPVLRYDQTCVDYGCISRRRNRGRSR